MLHAVCDLCGQDCDRVAYFLTIQPFSNFARYECDDEPFGNLGKKKSYVVCQKCEKALPIYKNT